MSNNTLKYIGLATVAAGAAYGSYKYGRTLLNKVTDLVTSKKAANETSEKVKPEVQEETVVEEAVVVETTVEETVETEVETIVEEVITTVEEPETETESIIETKEELEKTYEPTVLEDVIQCFVKLLLLEDEGVDIQDKINEYCELILIVKKEKGLNAKAFKAVIKRAGVLPNSHEWTRLFSDLRRYELQMATYEEA